MLKDHVSPFHKTLMIILALVLAGVVYLATIDTIAFLDNTDSELLGGLVKHRKTVTPTVTPTPTNSNWKIYQGDLGTKKYTIEYPTGLTPEAFPSGVDTDGVYFKAIDADNNITLSGIKISVTEREAVFGTPSITKKQYGVYKWDYFVNTDEDSKKVTIHYILSNNSTLAEVWGLQTQAVAIEHMVSTFKFTTIPTASWKTLKVPDLGLSFKYPPSWGKASISSRKNYNRGILTTIQFSQMTWDNRYLASHKNLQMGYVPKNYNWDGPGYIIEAGGKDSGQISNCKTFNAPMENTDMENKISCTNVIVDNKTIAIILKRPKPDDNYAGDNDVTPLYGYYFLKSGKNYRYLTIETGDDSDSMKTNIENLFKSIIESD